MAAIDLAMASRRLPLAVVPNAVNSPLRAGVTKRTRLQTDEHIDHVQPPAKKQMLEANQENVDPRAFVLTKVDDQFPKRPAHIQPTLLERKLAASREKRQPVQVLKHVTQDGGERIARPVADNMESVRAWQRHYRRQFPAFIFYLDGVPDEIRHKCVRHIRALGAREEKFFSNAVTHVVTTRQDSAPTTTAIRSAESSLQDTRKATNVLDHALQKRNFDLDARKPVPQVADVLTRARELGIKIWALEKLQRVLKTMFEADTGEQGPALDVDQHHLTNGPSIVRTSKDGDLEQLLRNEKINGPADRDLSANAQDMVSLKGCYIYIHDMDERTKPVMIRDYDKPVNKTDGKWPQFHMTAQGRCPFVEDQSYTKQQAQQEQAKAREVSLQRRARTAETRSAQPLAERSANLRRSPRKAIAQAKPLDPPQLPPARRTSQEEVPLFANIQTSSRAVPRMIGGMPIASGVQHSNVTSAIRSQVVSSTAISSTAPGMTRRMIDSKEITALKRKVLERGASAHSQAPSSYINDMRAAINDESAAPLARAAKRKAQESILGTVHEDSTAGVKQKTNAAKKRKSEKDPKPGYCENCRDKFDDFEEHIGSRKHLKFASSADNFKELDDLLARLKRPHRSH